jgi:uncharacterized membrane protein
MLIVAMQVAMTFESSQFLALILLPIPTVVVGFWKGGFGQTYVSLGL